MSMTPNVRILSLAAAAGLAVAALTGCSSSASASGSSASASAAAGVTKLANINTACASGVKVVIEYSAIGHSPEASCVTVTGTQSVSSVLSKAGIKVDGTPKYGDALVCRLNGLPAADEAVVVKGKPNYTETCADSTPMTYYWYMYTKDSATGAWTPAEKGVRDQQISAGQQVDFVYTTATEVPTATN